MKASFADALSFLPASVDVVDYVNWDALGHPRDFSSVVTDDMNDNWSYYLGIAPHSEQWSASIGTQFLNGTRGTVLHWRDPSIVVTIVAKLRSSGWRTSGTASGTKLTYPGHGNSRADNYLFLGPEVWSDTTTGTLIVNAHGNNLLPRATTPRLSLQRYRPLLNALPQAASITLNVGTVACDRFQNQPGMNPTFAARYRTAVAPFHAVISNAITTTATAIPDHVRTVDPAPIISDVWVQLPDAEAAKADLDARTRIGEKIAPIKGKNADDYTLIAKRVVGAIDHYTVTGVQPLQFGLDSTAGFDVCGHAR